MGNIVKTGNQNSSQGVYQASGINSKTEVRPGENGGHVFGPGEVPADSVQNGIKQLQQSVNEVQNQPQGEVKSLEHRKIESVTTQDVERLSEQRQQVENAPKDNKIVNPESPKKSNPLAKMQGQLHPLVNDFIGLFNQAVWLRNTAAGIRGRDCAQSDLRMTDTIIKEIESDSSGFKDKLEAAREDMRKLRAEITSPEIKDIENKIAGKKRELAGYPIWQFLSRRAIQGEIDDLGKQIESKKDELLSAFAERAGKRESYELTKLCPPDKDLDDLLTELKETRTEILEKQPELKYRYVSFGVTKHPFSLYPPTAKENQQIRQELAGRLLQVIAARKDLGSFEKLRELVDVALLSGDMTQPVSVDDPKLQDLMRVLDVRPPSAGKTPANVGTMNLKYGATLNTLAGDALKDILRKKGFEAFAPTNIKIGAGEGGTLEVSFRAFYLFDVKLKLLPEFDKRTGRLNLTLLERPNNNLSGIVGKLPEKIKKKITAKIDVEQAFAPGALYTVNLKDLKIPGAKNLGLGETAADNLSDIKFSKQGLQLRFGGDGEGSTIGDEPIAGDKLLEVNLRPSTVLAKATEILAKKDLASIGKAEIETRGIDQSVTLKLSDVAIGETAKKKMGVLGKILNFFKLTSLKKVEVSVRPKFNPHNGFVGFDKFKMKTSLAWPLSSLVNWAMNKFVLPKLTEKTDGLSNTLHQIVGNNDLYKLAGRRTEMRFEVTDSGIGLSCVERTNQTNANQANAN